MDNIIKYDGLYMLPQHPGSGDVFQHTEEIKRFKNVFSNVRKTPVMVELGSFWGLWSLIFKREFENSRILLIEPIMKNLLIGEKNFQLNDFECEKYNYGFYLNKLESNIINSIFLADTFDSSIDTTFGEFYLENNLDIIDCLHADIQSAELYLIDDILPLLKKGKILNTIIATHSNEIEKSILDKIKDVECEIKTIPLGTTDGEIYIKINKGNE